MVPASMFMYGSILMDVTRRPSVRSSRPVEDAITPLPIPEMTPPLTTMYFILQDTPPARCSAAREKEARRSDISVQKKADRGTYHVL